jgi:hypothetical protein
MDLRHPLRYLLRVGNRRLRVEFLQGRRLMEPTMHFRWLISHRNDYERVLQQAWRDRLSSEVEWRNVQEVIEPMVHKDLDANAGMSEFLGTPPATA